MKIALTTIGCKLNQSEIQDLKQSLQNAGYFIAEKNQPHGLHIINACSITSGAEQITRQKIREIKRHNPACQIFAMGCLNRSIPEIDKIFPNKEAVLRYIKKAFPIKIHNSKFPPEAHRPLTDMVHNSRTRALIKIQDGCNFNCAYCVITKFRGQSKSISPVQIIKQIKGKEKQGYQEIVLVGVNILLYKFGQSNFNALVKKILAETKIPRIRFSSLDPRLIGADFLALLKNPRLCPHLHISLQSGSDKILKQMGRNYTTARYLKIIQQARKINPLLSITTDIIIGFPGETNQNFNGTLNLVKKIDFLKIHIFPYSARPQTKAAEFKSQIPEKIKKERYQRLNALAQKQRAKFLAKMKGQIMLVLFEQKKQGFWQGYTPNYILSKKKSPHNLKNKIIALKI